MSRRIDPWWYAIALVLLLAGGLYAYHLATGLTPPRAAVTILGFPVYWYGIWIVTGVALGAWLVAGLAAERARRIFETTVPVDVRARPLAEAGLPDEVVAVLASRNIGALGPLLMDVGLDPRRLGLKKAQTTEMVTSLAAAPDIDPAWVSDAPWRRWNPEHVWNALIWILILGLIGARLYHVLTPSPSMAALGIYSPLDYFRDPIQLINFRGGGLGIFGGLIGGLLGLVIYTRRARIPFLGWADLAVVGLALGQAVGRWGNFFNQELYGRPTNLPWAVHIDPIYRLPDYVSFERFHPAFLYESLWSLATFFVLYRLTRRYSERLLPGEMMGLYLIAYAVGRSLLELVRLDSRVIPFFGVETGLAVATAVSIVIALASAVMLIGRRWSRRRRGVG
ncbi:MAG TPA: prolipoprotein diacylglyceryl transferase [Promineifilum sp.]|nr:prolipoprotein diacylglyceryl transferase [Promineifilum sp.]HRO89204.1 prolipoprotein diacylglyceryl transferase [Promineifilum sp.]HRQ13332.1 prolipoprotein diacylglyceryl transferase [Promineifilum sp.]